MGELLKFWTHGRRIERICYTVGALLMASGVAHAGILIFSGGSWDGPLSMRKAVTFGLSFGLTLISLGWVSTFLRMGDVLRRMVLGAFILSSIVEMGLVTLQMWRGRPSHFNRETVLDSAISTTLAVWGGVIILSAITLTVVSMRRNPDVSRLMAWAIRVGFVAFSGTMMVGGAMIARGSTLLAAGQAQAAYETAGALKPAHAVLMHAILVLPGLAWLLGVGGRPKSKAVVWGLAGYVLLAGVIVIESFTGIDPLDGPLALTAVAAAGAAMLAGAGVHALRVVGRNGMKAGKGRRQAHRRSVIGSR